MTHGHRGSHGDSHEPPADSGLGGGMPPANQDGSGSSRPIGRPVFAQPEPTADPATFRVRHPSDDPIYKEIDELNREHKIYPLPFPAPRGGVEPRLTLEQVLGGDDGPVTAIADRGQIVFHATGDCGSTRSPATENEVTDKLLSDFDEADAKEVPQFHPLLGNIVYSFGEAKYYYDQFYEPYRDYPAPILAVAGNHDGIVAPDARPQSRRLSAQFLRGRVCRDAGCRRAFAHRDRVCTQKRVWPHTVLAGHAHNYQRFTRTRRNGSQIPYVTCGNGGHNVQRLSRRGDPAIRTPQMIQAAGDDTDQVVFESYDDLNYGYLRVVGTAQQLRVEYHAASDGPGSKSPDDYVTVDLSSRRLTHFVATDQGRLEAARQVRHRRQSHHHR